LNDTRLEDLVANTPVLLCVGTGGVGKTTSAAAIALHAAMKGRKVLVLTVDPARRLAQSLGMDSLALEETRVSPERLAEAGADLQGELWAMMLDTRRIFDRVIAEHAPDSEARDRILANRYYQQLSTAAAGSHEYMAIEQLFTLRSEGRYDLIVLDTPPSQHAFDFLEAPDRMREFFGSASFKLVQGSSRHLGRWGAGLLKKDSVLLKGVGKFLGAGVFAEIIEFLQSFAGMTDGFTARAEEMRGLFRSRDVAFLVMTSPDRRTMSQSLRFIERLEEEGMRVGGLVVNRVRRGFLDPAESEDGLRERLRAALPGLSGQGDLAGRLATLVRAHGLLAEADAREIAALRVRLGERFPLLSIPAFARDVVDLAGLFRFQEVAFSEGA